MKPNSTVNFYISSLTCFLFFALLFIFYVPRIGLNSISLYFVFVLPLLPLFFYDFANGRKMFGDLVLPYEKVREFNAKRVFIKLLGLIVSYAFIAFLYWLFPIYHEAFFKPYWQQISNVLPVVGIVAVPYIIYVDNRMKDPEDGYFNLGKAVMLRFDEVDGRMVWEHLKCWIVKGFFLSLMTVYFLGNLNYFYNFDFKSIGSPKSIYDFMYNFVFTIDLLFAVYGYMFTLKMFNSQIYSTEPTVLGWVVCLMGYSPFWSDVFFGKYFNYEDNFFWGNWFWGTQVMYSIWAALIIGCLTIYALATVAFGYRFSNLTYRGLITTGPYRFTKHPAYVFKNISWWLISIPFIPTNGYAHALQTCILLFGINCIYYMRARTEENHLSNYPEYVAYAEYMNDHSIFRWVPRFLPFIRYSKERAQRSNSKVYKPFV